MRNQKLMALIFVWSIAVGGVSANAQVFNMRPLPNPGIQAGLQPNMAGTTVSGGPSTSLIQPPVQGIDRFLRTSREGRDFVGRNRADIKSFIGAQQAIAAGQVRPATDGLRPTSSASAAAKKVNQPLPPQPTKGIYYPKLVLDLNSGENESAVSGINLSSTELARDAAPQLLERIHRIAGDQIQLKLTGTKATLSGRANSTRNAELAAQVLEFEPGIDRVEIQLK